MKKMFILILCIIFLLVGLVILKNINIYDNKIVEPSLDEIKNNIIDTKKIYICKDSDNLHSACSGKKLIKIIDDENIIKKFINITILLEESTDNHTYEKSRYSIYFMNKQNKVITSAEFGSHYIIMTEKKNYYLSTEYIEELKELLGYKY